MVRAALLILHLRERQATSSGYLLEGMYHSHSCSAVLHGKTKPLLFFTDYEDGEATTCTLGNDAGI